MVRRNHNIKKRIKYTSEEINEKNLKIRQKSKNHKL